MQRITESHVKTGVTDYQNLHLLSIIIDTMWVMNFSSKVINTITNSRCHDCIAHRIQLSCQFLELQLCPFSKTPFGFSQYFCKEHGYSIIFGCLESCAEMTIQSC